MGLGGASEASRAASTGGAHAEKPAQLKAEGETPAAAPPTETGDTIGACPSFSDLRHFLYDHFWGDSELHDGVAPIKAAQPRAEQSETMHGPPIANNLDVVSEQEPSAWHYALEHIKQSMSNGPSNIAEFMSATATLAYKSVMTPGVEIKPAAKKTSAVEARPAAEALPAGMTLYERLGIAAQSFMHNVYPELGRTLHQTATITDPKKLESFLDEKSHVFLNSLKSSARHGAKEISEIAERKFDKKAAVFTASAKKVIRNGALLTLGGFLTIGVLLIALDKFIDYEMQKKTAPKPTASA